VRPGRAWHALWLVAVGIAAAGPAWPAEEDDAAVTALTSSLGVEQALLEEDRGRWIDLAAKRAAVVARLARLHESLDAAVRRDEAGATAEIEQLVGHAEAAEAERAELLASERVLVERIRDRLRRIVLFQEQLTRLRGREPPGRGELTGTWDVVLLPQDQRGTFELTQVGTIVTGVYRLSGGFTGSVQGTLVQNKIYLQRIDSQLGRSMEFEGRLSSDKIWLRGTWHGLDLSGGQAPDGQWSATRRVAAEE